jgi:ribosome-associated translation inhibitor RaiA
MEETMTINVHTDNHIQGREDVAATIKSLIEAGIGHFSDFITRVDAHLSDENGSKSGVDKRCLIEAHPSGAPATAVHCTAETVREAVDGAIAKMAVVLEKLHDKRIDRQRGRA